MFINEPSVIRKLPILVILYFAVSLFGVNANAENLKFHDSAGSRLPPSMQDNPPDPLDFVPDNYSPYLPKIVPGQFPGVIILPPGSAPGYPWDSRGYPSFPAYPQMPSDFPRAPYVVPR